MSNKRKLNLMDILIILFIAAVIAAAIYFLAGRNEGTAKDSGSGPLTTVEYRVQFKECDKRVADAYMAAKLDGGKAVVGAKERTDAVIKDVIIEPSRRQTTEKTEGEIFMTEIPGYYDVTVVLQSEATETEKNLLLSNTPVQVGENLIVHGKGIAGSGYVIDLKIVE